MMRSAALATALAISAAIPAAASGREHGAAARGCGFVGGQVLPRSGIPLRTSISPLRMAIPDVVGDFKQGDDVEVVGKDVIFFHVKPKDYPDGYTVPEGLKGTVKALVTTDAKTGKEVSPNRPLLVQFTEPKFMAHFEAKELKKC